MKTNIQTKIQVIKSKLEPILKRYPIKRAALFGSLTQGTDNAHSDVDLLLDFTQSISYSDYFDLYEEIEIALGKRVDISQYQLLKPYIKKAVLPTQIIIYEQR